MGAFKSTDARFVRFIEALASSSVRPDEAAQRAFMDAVDEVLKPYGVHFIVTIGADAYLEGQLTYLGGNAKASPKNLIFASKAKPDLRFSNALDNDIEVVSNADKVLMYDRAIGPAGLLWRDLQSWFEHTRGLAAGRARRRCINDWVTVYPSHRLRRFWPLQASTRPLIKLEFLSSQSSCRRSGFSGIRRRSLNEARTRCSVLEWIFCCCYLEESG